MSIQQVEETSHPSPSDARRRPWEGLPGTHRWVILVLNHTVHRGVPPEVDGNRVGQFGLVQRTRREDLQPRQQRIRAG